MINNHKENSEYTEKNFYETLGIGNENYINNCNDRISWDSYFIEMAYLASLRSHDSETKHGCCLVRNNRIIATGFNGFPPGSNDCEIPNKRADGKKYLFINHAEISAIFNAAKEGASIDNCVAYITGMPCSNCARSLVSVNVTEWVIASVGYQSSEEDDTLRQYWINRFNVNIRRCEFKKHML